MGITPLLMGAPQHRLADASLLEPKSRILERRARKEESMPRALWQRSWATQRNIEKGPHFICMRKKLGKMREVGEDNHKAFQALYDYHTAQHRPDL